MKNVAFALVVTAVASAALAAQPLDKTHTQERFPFTAPFVNPCTGETLTLIGDCHINTHTTTFADGTEQMMVRQNCTARGLGSFGNKYQFASIDKTDIVADVDDICDVEEQFESRGHAVANTKSEKYFFDVILRTHIDENCNLVVDEMSTDTECRGQAAP